MSDRRVTEWSCIGQVVARHEGRVAIAVEPGRCPGCAGACETRAVRVDVEDHRAWSPGDGVVLAMPRGPLRAAVIGLFGCPLAGLLVGAAWTGVIGGADAASEAAPAAVGLLIGALVGAGVLRPVVRAGVPVRVESRHADRNVEE